MKSEGRQKITKRYREDLRAPDGPYWAWGTPRSRPGRRAPDRRASVAEETCPAVVLVHLGGLTLGLQAVPAHEARATRDVERMTTRSPGAILVMSAPTSSTIPMGSWPRMSPVPEGPEHLVEVQVRAADATRSDLDDGVVRLLEDRVGHRFDPNVALAGAR